METSDAAAGTGPLARARAGDQAAFERLVAAHRGELFAHCYRMLGSPHDAEDALQESLLAAWRGLDGFEGRSSLRTWLYRIATRACLRMSAGRPPRLRSPDHAPPLRGTADLGEPVTGPVWLEPLPDELPGGGAEPEGRYLRREGVELAFVAALQHLPAFQRAVLILREVLQYPAAQVAEILGSTPPAVNSALQRARKAVAERVPPRSQAAELAALGPDGRRELVTAFVAAWERADVDGILALLADDVRFTMPPLPAWFDGRHGVARFLSERVFATAWRLTPVSANGQPAFACYQERDGGFRLSAVNVLGLRDGKITEIAAFLDPPVLTLFGLPEKIFPPER